MLLYCNAAASVSATIEAASAPNSIEPTRRRAVATADARVVLDGDVPRQFGASGVMVVRGRRLATFPSDVAGAI